VKEVAPVTWWQIDALLAPWPDHGCHQHLLPEEILAGVPIWLVQFRVCEIQRPQDRKRLGVRAPAVGIEVGNELRTQGEVFPHELYATLAVDPRHAQVALARIRMGTVHAQHGAEGAELDPACVQLEIDLAAVESTDVVTDVWHEHIASARGKRYFVGEHRPLGIGIAGEVSRITLAAPLPVASQYESSLASVLLAEVVEHLVSPHL